jgi:hypothetical protein
MIRSTKFIGVIVVLIVLAACGGEDRHVEIASPTPLRLEQAYRACELDSESRVTLEDEGTSIISDGPPEGGGKLDENLTAVACVLDELNVPDYITSQMDHTTSLMGLQEAEWDGIEASWSYHPDNGFDLVLHAASPSAAASAS